MTESTTAGVGTATGTPAPAVSSLHHIGITVTDIERSVRWYGDVLGLVQWGEERHPGGRTALLMRPGTHVHIGLDAHEANDGEGFRPHRTGLDHLALTVDTREEMDSWQMHLDALGVPYDPVRDLVEPAPCALITFRDPDGVALELIYMPPM